jgi:hypothetical protein
MNPFAPRARFKSEETECVVILSLLPLKNALYLPQKG